MPHRIRFQDCYAALRERLRLELIAGLQGTENFLLGTGTNARNDIVAGPLNYIHPNRIQVIGKAEHDYLQNLGDSRRASLQQLFDKRPAAVFLVDGVVAAQDLIDQANATDTPLLTSPLPDSQVLDNLQYYASLFLSEKTSLHGVFLDVLGMGVLITGDPAVGKSELALELISRGNRLVADDAPEFMRIAPDIISGVCPPLLREFLEVRGLGIINIRQMFGDSSVKRSKYLRLMVHLKRMSVELITGMDRLSGSYQSTDVLGVSIPRVTIPVASGRNLAILVEAAVRNHILKLQGYDATDKFIERQAAAIEQNQT